MEKFANDNKGQADNLGFIIFCHFFLKNCYPGVLPWTVHHVLLFAPQILLPRSATLKYTPCFIFYSSDTATQECYLELYKSPKDQWVKDVEEMQARAAAKFSKHATPQPVSDNLIQ